MKTRLKRNIYILTLVIFFYGCYSYKPVTTSAEEIRVNNKYKIKTKNSEKIKAQVYKVSDSIVYYNKKGVLSEVEISDIETIKVRKFSYTKTIGVSLGTLALTTYAYVMENLPP